MFVLSGVIFAVLCILLTNMPNSFLFFRKLDPVNSPIWKPEDVNMYDEVVFQGQQKVKQVLWPRHAVQNTSGAELHKDLKVSF